jgi:hypothetical protein
MILKKGDKITFRNGNLTLGGEILYVVTVNNNFTKQIEVSYYVISSVGGIDVKKEQIIYPL